MKFSELNFVTRKSGSIQARETFSNGYSISVVAGDYLYSEPRESVGGPENFKSFEVAVFNEDGEFCTKKFADINDDVMGWVDRDEIEFLMCCIENKCGPKYEN